MAIDIIFIAGFNIDGKGITGPILFDTKDNPVDKAIVVLKVVDDGSGSNKIVIQEIIGTFL